MNNKMLLSLLAAGALIGIACHAHRLELYNTKPGSTFYVVTPEDKTIPVSPANPYRTELTSRGALRLAADKQTADQIQEEMLTHEKMLQFILKKRIIFLYFEPDWRNPDKTYIINAFYTPKEGFIIQPRSHLHGKKLVNNVSEQELRWMIFFPKMMQLSMIPSKELKTYKADIQEQIKRELEKIEEEAPAELVEMVKEIAKERARIEEGSAEIESTLVDEPPQEEVPQQTF